MAPRCTNSNRSLGTALETEAYAADPNPHETTLRGVMRIRASPESGASSASADPWIITDRGRHGGKTSSTMKATLGLAATLQNFLVAAKFRPEMSIVPRSAL